MPTELDIDMILSQTDGRPMYLQIMEQIKNRIATGDWQSGQQLPSIREMAVATKVSVITVKRAYQELESEGIIFTQQGKGSYIAEIDNLSIQLKEKEMEKYLQKAIDIAHSMGLSIKDLQDKIAQLHDDKTHAQDTQLEKNND